MSKFVILPKRSVVENCVSGEKFIKEVPSQIVIVADESLVRIHHIGNDFHITVDLPEGLYND